MIDCVNERKPVAGDQYPCSKCKQKNLFTFRLTFRLNECDIIPKILFLKDKNNQPGDY